MKKHLLCGGSTPEPSGPGPLDLVRMELIDRVAAPVPPPRIRCRSHFGAGASGRLRETSTATANVLRPCAQRVIHERERTVMIA